MLKVVGRRPESPPAAKPDPTALLSALPVPLLLLDSANRFRFANHAAEQFLGISVAQLAQLSLADLVPLDNPIFQLIDQVRAGDLTISDHDLTLESPRLQRCGLFLAHWVATL